MMYISGLWMGVSAIDLKTGADIDYWILLPIIKYHLEYFVWLNMT